MEINLEVYADPMNACTVVRALDDQGNELMSDPVYVPFGQKVTLKFKYAPNTNTISDKPTEDSEDSNPVGQTQEIDNIKKLIDDLNTKHNMLGQRVTDIEKHPLHILSAIADCANTISNPNSSDIVTATEAKDEKAELKNTINELKSLAQQYDIPVITAHQHNPDTHLTVDHNHDLEESPVDIADIPKSDRDSRKLRNVDDGVICKVVDSKGVETYYVVDSNNHSRRVGVLNIDPDDIADFARLFKYSTIGGHEFTVKQLSEWAYPDHSVTIDMI